MYICLCVHNIFQTMDFAFVSCRKAAGFTVRPWLTL